LPVYEPRGAVRRALIVSPRCAIVGEDPMGAARREGKVLGWHEQLPLVGV